MRSEQRLHPAAILFDLGRQLRNFALPGLLLLFTSSRSTSNGPFPGGPQWNAWWLLFIIPAMVASVTRFLTFRLRYDAHELVISQGLFFRSERHVPYARIQNLDAVQNVVHRVLGVVEVRIETGGGNEAEASIRVLPMTAFTEMRRRVFAGRTAGSSSAEAAVGEAAQAPAASTLLRLSPRDLLLYGFIESRGMVVIGAAYGALWQMGLLDGFWRRVPGAEQYGRAVVDRLSAGTSGQAEFPFGLVVAAIAGLVGLLLIVRLLSMLWALVRLHGFSVTRAGDDLRTQFGVFTRVTATIPLHHVQTVIVRDGLLHRWTGRTSVRVETAGSDVKGDGASEREWLAPIIARDALPAFLRHVIPLVDVDALEWQPVHPRAFVRAVKPAFVVALGASLALGGVMGWWAAATLPFTLGAAVVATRRQVAQLAWMADADVVVFRSGWLWRQVTIARTNRIQAVALHQSPFDRRASMASVRVDTAGASAAHRVDIPYLDVAVAQHLHARLAAQAAQTEFRW